MKPNLGVIIIATIFLVGGFNFASPQEAAPEDQPNFPPQITKDTQDGHDVEIIEFKCKLK